MKRWTELEIAQLKEILKNSNNNFHEISKTTLTAFIKRTGKTINAVQTMCWRINTSSNQKKLIDKNESSNKAIKVNTRVLEFDIKGFEISNNKLKIFY